MMKNIIIIAALLLSTTIAEAQNQRSRVRQNNTNTTQARTGARGQRSASTPSFNQVLTTRRSVRNYDATKKISEAEVRMLLKSVQDAPSWANMQPTKYYVAISEEKLTAVQKKNESRMPPCSLFPHTNEASQVSSKEIQPTKWVMDGEPTTMV